MFVCCECCVLSGRGLCDELITHPEESYRLWCVIVCDLENLKNEEAMTCVGSQRHSKKKKKHYIQKILWIQLYLLTLRRRTTYIYVALWRSLTLRRLMLYMYMEHPFLMFLDHTQRRSTVGRTPLDE